MREKHIELITEYLKLRPDYKTNLNEIKGNVLLIGATEEEFREALRRTIAISLPNVNKNSKGLLEDLKNAYGKIPQFDIKSKKKYFTAIAVLIIILLFTTAVDK